MVSPWPPRTKAETSSTETLNSSAKKKTEAGRVQYAGHADHPAVRKAGGLAHHPDHHIERIGDDDDESVRAMGAQRLADFADDLGVDADEIVAAHAGLARHAGGDNR